MVLPIDFVRVRPAPPLALPLAVFAFACTHAGGPKEPARAGEPGGGGPLDVRADSAEIRDHPALRGRLHATPHGYYRFINAPFTREVCRRFADIEAAQPAVTLHGDCHVEQYAVTELGRGLTDFDDSAGGPAFVDIVRFGVSLRIAAQQRGWGREAGWIHAAFRKGYRQALLEPKTEAPVPAVARRIMATFKENRAESLARSEALMETLEEKKPELDEARKEMVLTQVAKDAGLPEAYFHAKKIGLLRVGIGSALAAKYLIRVEGFTESDDDDVLVEAKEVLDREGLGCIEVTPGPSRIFAGEQRLAYQPFRYPGILHVGGKTFWVHAWTDHYVELDIQKELRSVQELREIAYDVGVQLGRGHPKRFDDESAARLRLEIVRTLPEARIEKEIVALADETLRAWNRFRRDLSAASRAGR
jgi:Uncharacterized protein conserved in bacteria (DUF2252)